MKNLILLVYATLMLQSIFSIEKDNPVLQIIKDKLEHGYSAGITTRDTEKLQYYSDEKKYYDIKTLSNSSTTGWTNLIFYSNKTGYKNLKAIEIAGFRYGNPNKFFKIKIFNLKGKEIYESKDLSYSIFPEKTDEAQIITIELPIKKIPQNFIIEVVTNAKRDSGISIYKMPTNKNVFSFEYHDKENYKEYDHFNSLIMPVFN